MNVYNLLAIGILAVHLTWLVWVIFGWLVTRRRPILRWLHIGSLVYGIFIEVSYLPCPLTLAETYFEQRAGIEAYQKPFLVHYFEALIYPSVSPALLTWCAAAVCVAILGIYVIRFRRRRSGDW